MGLSHKAIRELIRDPATDLRVLRDTAEDLLDALEKSEQLLRRIHKQHGLKAIRVSTESSTRGDE